MKRLDELGVSPAPWTMERYSPESTEDGRDIKDANKQPVGCTYTISEHAIADARLIAAAPELYDIVWEMVHERCRDCQSLDRAADRCTLADNSCFQRWRKALEKAGGAE